MANKDLKSLKIIVFISKKDLSAKEKFLWLEKIWSSKFKLDLQIKDPKEISDVVNSQKKLDIVFFTKNELELFTHETYDHFHSKNQLFILSVFKDKMQKEDANIYKELVDNIIYLDNDEELLKWHTIAILRRYWDYYSKSTTIIYKGIIIDFIKKNLTLNSKVIKLTSKEFEVIYLLLKSHGKYLTKHDIFKKVWEVEDIDTTRVVDQIIFKLKKKLGSSFFTYKRLRGIKFE